jgi:hypothetical protein
MCLESVVQYCDEYDSTSEVREDSGNYKCIYFTKCVKEPKHGRFSSIQDFMILHKIRNFHIYIYTYIIGNLLQIKIYRDMWAVSRKRIGRYFATEHFFLETN